MRKLFKEVWKSFRKSKIILIGLTLLIFLCSGFITLLLDISKTYNNKYEQYKKNSKLHDLTVNSNINPFGQKPSTFYLPPQPSNPKNNLDSINAINNGGEISYTFANNNEKPKLSGIYIPKNYNNISSDNIALNTVFTNTSSNTNNVPNIEVSKKEIAYLFNIYFNDIKQNLQSNSLYQPQISLSTDFNFSKKNINLISAKDLFVNNFKINNKTNSNLTFGDFVLLDNLTTPQPNLSKSYNLKPLFFLVPNIQNPNYNSLTLYDQDALNSLGTSLSPFDRNNNLICLQENQIAKILGLIPDPNNFGRYIFPDEQTNLQEYQNCLFTPFSMLPTQSNDFLTLPLNVNKINNTNLNLNLATTFGNKYTFTNYEPITLKKGTYTFSKDFLIYTTLETIFTRKYLTFDTNINNWSGIYQQYIENIYLKDSVLQNKFKNVADWSKKVKINLINGNNQPINNLNINDEELIINGGVKNTNSNFEQLNQELNVEFLLSDLNQPLIIYQPNLTRNSSVNTPSTTTTIRLIETQGNEATLSQDINDNELLANVSNPILSQDKQSSLSNLMNNWAYQQMFNKLVNDVSGVENIGLRQSLTVNDGKQIYQLINVGDKNQQLEWNGIKIKNNVDKLINNENNPLFTTPNSIDPFVKNVPLNQVPKILNELLIGLSLNREYISPMTSFQTFSPDIQLMPDGSWTLSPLYKESPLFNPNADINIMNSKEIRIQQNAKIVWMANEDIDYASSIKNRKDNIVGISVIRSIDNTTSKTLYFLKPAPIEVEQQFGVKWILDSNYYNDSSISPKEYLKKYSDFASWSKVLIDNKLNFTPFDFNYNPMQIVQPKGWVVQNSQYKNKYYVSYEYLLPKEDIIRDFNTSDPNNPDPSKRTYGFQIFRDNLIKYLTLNVKDLISPQDLAIMMEGVNIAFGSYGFGEALTPPAALSMDTVVKMVTGWLYQTSKITPERNFTNGWVTQFLRGIKEYINKNIDPNSPNANQEALNVLASQVGVISNILQMTIGITLPDISQPIFGILKINNVNNLLDGLIDIINSIDLDQTAIDLFTNYYLNYPGQKAQNQILGIGDWLPLLFKNLKDPFILYQGLGKLLGTSANDPNKAITIDWSIISPSLKDLTLYVVPNKQEIKAKLGVLATINNLFTNPSKIYSNLLNNIYLDEEPLDPLNPTTSYKVIYNSIDLKPLLLSIFDGATVSVSLLPSFTLNSILENFITNSKISTLLYNPDQKLPLELDLDLLWFLRNYVFAGSNEKLFGVKLYPFLARGTDSFVELTYNNNRVVYDENVSYLAQVNEAYLLQNNKSVYTDLTNGQLDFKIDENGKIVKLDGTVIDDKYKLNIGNLEYLICGTNLTADYLYPVINNENIQVNTKNQALVYVNNFGFDRAKNSNANASEQTYFVLKSNNSSNLNDLQTNINKQIYSYLTGIPIDQININVNDNETNIYKKAFLYNETSPYNPEIAMRITIIDQFLSMLNGIELLVSILLIVLIGLVVFFVVRRYIFSRAKVIGILISQGYTTMQIALSICLFALITCVIGGVLGYIVGHFLQFAAFDLFNIYWTIPIQGLGFNWITMLLTVFLPFIGMSLIIIILTRIFLNISPIKLMNDSFEVSNSTISNKVQQLASKSNIKNKFSISLAMNSISKLLALFLSLVIASTTSMFALSTAGSFEKANKETFSGRDYVYKIDLVTPTNNSTQMQLIRLSDYANNQLNELRKINNQNLPFSLNNMLYVPRGDISEGQLYRKDYFALGRNEVINGKSNANGNPLPNTPHIFTKSSLDLVVNAGGQSINVWDTFFNSVPESQRASIIENSQLAAKWLEWTQEGHRIVFKGIDDKGTTPTNEVKVQLYNNSLDKNTFLPTPTQIGSGVGLVGIDLDDHLILKFDNYDKNGNTKDYILTIWNETKKGFVGVQNGANEWTKIRVPFYKYIINFNNPKKSHFVFAKNVAGNNNKYFEQEIIIGIDNTSNNSHQNSGLAENSPLRVNYRNFLVNGYEKMFTKQATLISNTKNDAIKEQTTTNNNILELIKLDEPKFVFDYFITPGAILLDTNDEVYSNIQAKITNGKLNETKININGFDPNSSFVHVLNDSYVNLLTQIDKVEINQNDPIYPVAINNVVLNKYNLKVGDILELNILNSCNKFENMTKLFLNKENKKSIKVKIYGIVNTFISDEWVTSRKIANMMLGFKNQTDLENNFNAILTKNTSPLQLENSLPIYSQINYWAAEESFNISKDPSNDSNAQKTEAVNHFNQLIYNLSASETPSLKINPTDTVLGNLLKQSFNLNTNEEIENKIWLFIGKQNPSQTLLSYFKDENGYKYANIYNVLNRFISFYGNKALSSSYINIYSNGVEKDYLNNISNTLNQTLTIIISLSFIISMIILIMITSMIINENEKNIAIFSILGFNIKEKIRMFFLIYLPIIIFGIAIGALITWALLPIFASSILATSAISLSLSLTFPNILITFAFIFTIFILTSIIIWAIQGRIKPIMLLKEV